MFQIAKVGISGVESNMGTTIRTAVVLVMAWANMIFPYLAKFRNSNKMILKNCFGIGLLNFPIALLQPVFFVLAIVGIAFFPIGILCAPGVYMVLSCYTLEPVFRKYMSAEDRAAEEQLLRDLNA